MTYAPDSMARAGSGAAGIGSWIAGVGRAIWYAMISAQERRAQRLIETYKRDGFVS